MISDEIPVWLFAVSLIFVGLVLTAPVSYRLASAKWTRRSPRPALVLWQAMCLAAGFSVVAGLVLLAVQPLGDWLLGGAWNWFAAVLTGTLDVPPWRLLCGLIALLIAGLLLTVLLRTALMIGRRRRAHRRVLDLLTGSGPQPGRRRLIRSADVRILDHRAAVAYTVPGWHSRVVLSAGLVDLLTEGELSAVVEHERAHLRARHDLLVLPFQAWAVALGWVPGVRPAGRAVSELTEMLADDNAAGRTSCAVLASALAKVALSGPQPLIPVGRLAYSSAIAGTAVTDRVRRMLDPQPLSRWQVVLVYGLCLLLLAIPASVLLLHWS